MAKKERPVIKREVKLFLADPNSTPVSELQKMEDQQTPSDSPLIKSIMSAITERNKQDEIQRIAFERDPTQNNEYAAVYRQKIRLIPDYLLKRVALQDDLVASIVNARSNQISAFGRPRPDRFSLGFSVEIKQEIAEKASEEQKTEIYKRIDKFEKKLLTCGETSGWENPDQLTLPRYLALQTRNALVVGRMATEFIYAVNDNTGEMQFHSFRPVDAGTIYRAAPYKNSKDAVRKQAKKLMETMLNKKLEDQEMDSLDDNYPWVQVIDGKPVQVFKSKELHVHNFYPVTDIELQGYPLTPIDSVIAAITTHINITTHNKLFFQSGRAAKGMLVIKSEDLDEAQVKVIRQQFNANINNVNNSWRIPVFNVGKDDDVQFQPIETTSRDMEFQYLSDTNARVILSAFQMSPEELPGYAHLSRGTNNQALSESNKEYQLEAHRDTGIRPLLSQFEDFFNNIVFKVMDAELSKLCVIKLVGLDADTAEKESVRISTDAPLHMTYDQILSIVEKDPVGKEWGGEFPLNPSYQMVLDKYVPVGMILEHFFNMKGASKDPQFQYVRDPFFFQNIQLQMQMQQMQMAQQQAQAQAAQGAPPPEGGGGGEGSGGGEEGPPKEEAKGGEEGGGQPQQEEQQQNPEEGGDLTTSIDQLTQMLGKSEKQLSPSRRRLLAQQKATVKHIMDAWEEDSKKSLNDILDIAEKFTPTKKD